MSKMKTNKAAAKRFKVTGKGRIRRPKGGGQHNLSGKSRKRRRRLRNQDMSACTKGAKLPSLRIVPCASTRPRPRRHKAVTKETKASTR
jgi:large subunit ribosomal protein L35